MPPQHMIDTSKPLVDQLEDDNLSLRIYSAKGHAAQSFLVQKTFLASVSTKLANHCIAQSFVGICVLSIGSKVLKSFFEWMLRRPLKIDKQETMVRAWQFGREWEIPAFQNEVMRCIIASFENNYVDLWAMGDAYQFTTATDVARDKLLRKAIITEFAYESRVQTWVEKDLVESGLDRCAAFHRDYTRIMCLAFEDNDSDSRTHGARIEDLLVSETIDGSSEVMADRPLEGTRT